MSDLITASYPTALPEQPQSTTTDPARVPPTLDQVNGLWADLHAGRIAMTDFLTRLAEMHSAFLGV